MEKKRTKFKKSKKEKKKKNHFSVKLEVETKGAGNKLTVYPLV